MGAEASKHGAKCRNLIFLVSHLPDSDVAPKNMSLTFSGLRQRGSEGAGKRPTRAKGTNRYQLGPISTREAAAV